jgi:exopolyphosphatase/guanosine-5'-triphosphate,3'-diphosphate pyrophosphatase
MDLLGLDAVTFSDWSLQEGLILDVISRHEPSDWADDPGDIRRAAVLGLARRCNWEEAHGRSVAGLACSLFDQTLPVHHLPTADRDLLEYAALLHDIGQHVARESHHKHTSYLIRNGQLRGFDPNQVNELAALARYHRRSEPKVDHEPFASLDDASRSRVTQLAAILRIADGLDCGHASAVDGVDVEVEGDRMRVSVHGEGDIDLELWGARRKRGLFERTFGHHVEFVAVRPSA